MLKWPGNPKLPLKENDCSAIHSRFSWVSCTTGSSPFESMSYDDNNNSTTPSSYVSDLCQKKTSQPSNTCSSSHTLPLLNRPALGKATLIFLCLFFCVNLYSKYCQVFPITVIIYVSFEDKLAWLSLQGKKISF